MATKSADSSQWSPSEVLAQLRAKAGSGPVAAQVFLHDDTPTKNLTAVAQEIVSAAKEKVGKTADATVGKIHPFAKSFSLRADVDTLAAVADMPGVKTILPSEISDVFPRPAKVNPV